ncbi:MAG: hypothetical protein HC822_12960 [Oscillochloris sp.]|nr:hypothetical protein [Oscillochloris sp.]
MALRWITLFPEVRCAIPGGRRPDQVEDNVAAGELAPFDPGLMQAVAQIDDRHIRGLVHQRW